MTHPRVVPGFMDAPCHDGLVRPCAVFNHAAVHTVELPGQGHFAALVHSRAELKTLAAIVLLDRAEMECLIVLLRNAIEDAERLDAGMPPIHVAHSLMRN